MYEPQESTLRSRSDSFLLHLETEIRPLTDPEAITLTAATLLGQYLDVDRSAYADVEPDQDSMNLTGNYLRDPGIKSIVGRLKFSEFGAEVLRLMREDKPYVVNDVDTHEPPVGDPAAYRATQIQAVICVPLHKEGKFVAAMAVHSKTPRIWMPHEVELVQYVASRCWESILRAKALRTLRESEDQFRLLANSIPQLAWMARPDGHIFWYNERWYDYTGCTFEEMQGWGWEKVHDPVQLARMLPGWRNALARGEAWEDTFPLRRHDGAFRWHLSRAVPLRCADGKVSLWFGTNTDIENERRLKVEREHLLEAERAARTEAERISRMKDEFLATLSHELRTPLNAIVGWAQILKSDEVTSEDLRQGVEVIYRNARAQAQLVDDLLDMSRIISGRFRLDIQPIDLSGSIHAAIESVQPSANAKRVRIEKVIHPAAGMVNGDPARLQQVFWNLLSNAVKFTPPGGKVRVTLDRVKSHLEVSISDNGQGIKPEFLGRVFDRFSQADGSITRRHGGLGLGLSIVRQLVEMHNGSVWVMSEGEGKGSTFVTALPLATEGMEYAGGRVHETDDADAEPPQIGTLSLAGLKILAIDDEQDARELVRRVLENSDATVITAASAEEGLELLNSERIDIIVCDIGMPEVDGYEFIRRVRTMGTGSVKEIPAVALTAFVRSADRQRALLAGYQMHVAKPAEPVELVTVVASVAARTPQRTGLS